MVQQQPTRAPWGAPQGSLTEEAPGAPCHLLRTTLPKPTKGIEVTGWGGGGSPSYRGFSRGPAEGRSPSHTLRLGALLPGHLETLGSPRGPCKGFYRRPKCPCKGFLPYNRDVYRMWWCLPSSRSISCCSNSSGSNCRYAAEKALADSPSAAGGASCPAACFTFFVLFSSSAAAAAKAAASAASTRNIHLPMAARYRRCTCISGRRRISSPCNATRMASGSSSGARTGMEEESGDILRPALAGIHSSCSNAVSRLSGSGSSSSRSSDTWWKL